MKNEAMKNANTKKKKRLHPTITKPHKTHPCTHKPTHVLTTHNHLFLLPPILCAEPIVNHVPAACCTAVTRRSSTLELSIGVGQISPLQQSHQCPRHTCRKSLPDPFPFLIVVVRAPDIISRIPYPMTNQQDRWKNQGIPLAQPFKYVSVSHRYARDSVFAFSENRGFWKLGLSSNFCIY